MNQTQFKVGDRVTRNIDINGNMKKHGIVTQVTTDKRNYIGKSNDMYAVLFDDGSHGVFLNGLELEVKSGS